SGRISLAVVTRAEYGLAMDRILAHTRANRISWNEIAPARPVPTPEFYLNGGSTLEDYEPDLLPDVAGRRMLHLACANGADSVSWAFLGASVTGVDISDVGIEAARSLARETGADARFVVADLFEMPEELRDFDVIYASAGVVCWLPDLDRWARMIAERLRPGGTFLLNEHHPIWEVLGVRRPGEVAVTVDYFGRSRPTAQTYDQAKRPVGSTPETEFDAFLWPVSDVVMSLVRAGLRIEEFFEAPFPDMYDGLGDAATRLPAVYVIRAEREDREVEKGGT
ncbi:MAG TPA: class I SAM-dependent methyltransferase, partial [Actinopolymorphaceae bacterium]